MSISVPELQSCDQSEHGSDNALCDLEVKAPHDGFLPGPEYARLDLLGAFNRVKMCAFRGQPHISSGRRIARLLRPHVLVSKDGFPVYLNIQAADVGKQLA
jgi:hypothetical protein